MRVLGVLAGVLLLTWGGEEFMRRKIGGFAGSYPFVEAYDFNVSQSELNQLIEEVKIEQPDLRPLKDSSYARSYWYYVSFRYKDTDELVRAWTREVYRDSTSTTLAFISLTSGPSYTDVRLINRDFWFLANKREIAKFKREIVERIEEKISEHAGSNVD